LLKAVILTRGARQLKPSFARRQWRECCKWLEKPAFAKSQTGVYHRASFPNEDAKSTNQLMKFVREDHEATRRGLTTSAVSLRVRRGFFHLFNLGGKWLNRQRNLT
jgi:hypothetical protein